MLSELEKQMYQLVQKRDAAINAAEALIKQANREFDQAALPLGREISRLKAEQPKPHKPSQRRVRHHLEGLTEQEIEHYEELLRRKG